MKSSDAPIILTYGSLLTRTGLPPLNNTGVAPDCPCGCGGKAAVKISNRDELIVVMSGLCFEMDCKDSAVFGVQKNGHLLTAYRYYNEEVEEECIDVIDDEIGFDFVQVGLIYEELDRCCYLLLYEIEDDTYMVVENDKF